MSLSPKRRGPRMGETHISGLVDDAARSEGRVGAEWVAACPICRTPAERAGLFERTPSPLGVLEYRLCPTCGLVFQSPRLSEGELQSFYAAGYRELVQGTEEPTGKDLHIQRLRARHLLALAEKRSLTIQRHLDIGSSTGALLEAFASRFGCDGVGIEPGDEYRRWSRRRGLEVYADLPAMEAAETERFDLITLAHVLEHLREPVAYLSHLRARWLLPEGALIIEVPNLFGHRSAEVSHLFLFSPATLRSALAGAGFDLTELKVHGEPRSPLLQLYLTASASPRGEAAPPAYQARPALIHLRRWIAMRKLSWLTRWAPRFAWRPLPPEAQERA